MPPKATGHVRQTQEVLQTAATRLASLAGASPRLEAELLLTHASGWSRTQLLAWPERELDPALAETYETLVARRLSGEPIAYLRGRQAFWTLELKVSPATLIPRPETELLVETALALLPRSQLDLVELGTGSGAIAAALASERPAWQLIATDQSTSALAIARENFTALDLGRIAIVRGDWLRAFADDSLDVIVSNPPYIRDGDPHLGQGDLRFEPRRALTSGGDGLDAIRAIALDATRCLRTGGLVIVEHGFDQGALVRGIFIGIGLTRVDTRRDLADHDRVTLGYR
jgi:release factor glutamine methyltransferase